jgi:hypothetical protein
VGIRVGGGVDEGRRWGDEGTMLEAQMKGKSYTWGIRQRVWYRVGSGDKGRKLTVAIKPEG